MPNWVKANLHFAGKKEEVSKLREFVKSVITDDNGKQVTKEFDFNKIVPMPDELNIVSGTLGDNGMRYLMLNDKHPIVWTDDQKKFMDEMEKLEHNNPERFNETIELGRQYLSNLSKYGCTTWYSFCNKFWGTKWNACEVYWYADDAVEFETAWSFPHPVIQKLSELFPEIEISFFYADEDCGSNTGEGIYLNGQEKDAEYPDTGSKRAYEIYLELHPEYEDELVYNPDIDNYEWVETDEDE